MKDKLQVAIDKDARAAWELMAIIEGISLKKILERALTDSLNELKRNGKVPIVTYPDNK